jgi:hypothetical protein
MGQPVSIPSWVTLGTIYGMDNTVYRLLVLPTSSITQIYSVMSGQFGGVSLVLGCGVASWSWDSSDYVGGVVLLVVGSILDV